MKLIPCCALALVTLAPAVGLAQVNVGETDRSMAVGLRFGSFKPGVDEQFDFVGPYERIFGNSGETAFALVVDMHVFTGFGALSLGGSVGYWNVEGEGIPEEDTDAAASGSTEFIIWPFQGQVTYRFDPFADIVPIVPVLRAGIDYYAWDILDGSGETTQFAPGKDASGGTWGYHYSVGLHLLLDFFAPEMALDFDRDAGVNNSYLTFDYEITKIDDFGSADSFRLSSETFYFGLAIDL